jgi:type I protein arginine methyltransferase
MSDSYSLRDYGEMIADATRFGAYAKAIETTVRPGDVVLEIGCGPGLFALLACRAGARRVYAIESDDVVNVARQLAAANGLADRIQFIQSDSRRAQLPDPANVIISDIRGSLPLYSQAIPSIEDARQRFLAPGGVLIPQRDTLKAAVIEAKKYYSRLVAPWRKSVRGMDFSASLSLILNEFYSSHFKNEQLLTEPQTWCTLDYTTGAPRRASAELQFRALRNGTAHGVCVWFETQLFEEIGYSSGPGGAATIYGHAFFPWLSALPVVEGQEIQVGLHADLVGQDYVWRWDAKIPARGGGQDICFQQSTFQGANLSSQSLRRRATDFVPVLSEAGQADRWLLQAMDGSASLREIAQSASARFPHVFSCWDDALRRASELAEKLSR